MLSARTERCIGNRVIHQHVQAAIRVHGVLHGRLRSAFVTHIQSHRRGAIRKGALAAFDRCADNLRQASSVLVDGGYSGKPFAEAVAEKLNATVQVAKRNELHTFAVLPQRWVVERSFAWLEKCRRLWKNCERSLNTSLQMVHLAFLVLLLRRS